MKKYLSVFIGGLLGASAYLLPLQAMENHICDSEHIFKETKGGKATLPQGTTNADLLHKEGIKGQLKNGKPLLVAIIDMGFHPKFTASLKEEGVIHPAAFSDRLILDSDEDLENVNPAQLLYNLIWNLKAGLTREEYAQVAAQINQLNEKIARFNTQLSDRRLQLKLDIQDDKLNDFGKKNKKEVNDILDKLNDLRDGKIKNIPIDPYKSVNAHGSAVMDAIHLMAPKAQLLPIDLFRFRHGQISNKSLAFVTAQAIDKAIDYGVDVINLSQNLRSTPEMVAVCKKAAQRGVPIIVAAGNDSTKNNPVSLRKHAQDLFDKVGGKGIRFAGALKYGKTGEEKLTSYTQLPHEKTQNHFIFGAGNNFPVRYNPSNPDQLDGGTCWTTAIITGGYVLAKGMADIMGYQASSEELLEMMFTTGRNVHYTFKPMRALPSVPAQAPAPVTTNTRALSSRPAQAPAPMNVKRADNAQYFIGKSLDLWRVKQTIEAKVMALNPVLKAPRALPSIPGQPINPIVKVMPEAVIRPPIRSLPSIPS